MTLRREYDRVPRSREGSALCICGQRTVGIRFEVYFLERVSDNYRFCAEPV